MSLPALAFAAVGLEVFCDKFQVQPESVNELRVYSRPAGGLVLVAGEVRLAAAFPAEALESYR